jgi:hypothetical protein
MNISDDASPFLNDAEAATHDWEFESGEPDGSRTVRCRICGLLASNHGALYAPLDGDRALRCAGLQMAESPPRLLTPPTQAELAPEMPPAVPA